MKLKLTFEETKMLEECGCVYALRDKICYLVENDNGRLRTTIINANVEIVKTYQCTF